MVSLTSDFFNNRPTDQIARDMFGLTLLKHTDVGDMGGVIVETEAYMGDQDTTAHAFGHRKSQSNAALFGAPGTLYFYTMRGLILMNLICQPEGTPQGILLRAIEPTIGVDLMQKHRHKQGIELANGPAKMTAAFGVNDLQFNNISLTQSPFTLWRDNHYRPRLVAQSARIGVSKGDWQNRELRFYVAGNPYVSGMGKRDMDWDTRGWVAKATRFHHAS